MRIGMGYDVHRLVEDRDLIIGGEKIEYEYGLLGHSDADVLLHAIMDALLGRIFRIRTKDIAGYRACACWLTLINCWKKMDIQ